MPPAALLLLLFGLATAPLGRADVRATPVTETCASACCEADPACCATACPCPPLSCNVPAAPAVMIPVTHPFSLFAPGSSPGVRLTDDTCSERTARPPVPPPRA